MEVIYTESQIRKAWAAAFGGPHIPTFPSWSAEALVRKLKENDHVHDFTDTDTVTVKEIREAWKRLRYDSLVAAEPKSFLRDISEHREPEYEPGTVVKDALGVFWFMTGKAWLRFGWNKVFPLDAPKRPLFRMTEMP